MERGNSLIQGVLETLQTDRVHGRAAIEAQQETHPVILELTFFIFQNPASNEGGFGQKVAIRA